MHKGIQIVAHRGVSAEAPEATIPAFDLAIQQGYTHLETDIQLTLDQVPVCFHDDTLDRTTDGTGPISEVTYEELMNHDAGSWFGSGYERLHIPAMEEILDRYKGAATFHFEEKSEEPQLPEIIGELLVSKGWIEPWGDAVSAASPVEPPVVISAFERKHLLRSKALLPASVPHELLVIEVTDESLEWAAEHGMRSIIMEAAWISPELVQKASDLNLRSGAWWMKRESQDLAPLAEAGAHYAFVDAPHLHAPALRKLGALSSSL